MQFIYKIELYSDFNSKYFKIKMYNNLNYDGAN